MVGFHHSTFFNERKMNRVLSCTLLLMLSLFCKAQIITTIAGSDTMQFYGDGGPATNARFQIPGGIAIDGIGNIYIGDIVSQRIRKIDTFGIIRTMIGNGSTGCPTENQLAIFTSFNYIAYIYIYNDTEMFIPDYYCSNLYKVGTSGLVNKIAGNSLDTTTGDNGLATNAAIQSPINVIVRNKNIYFSDGYARIRMIDTLGIIHTIAGTTQGYGGDNGPVMNAQLFQPGTLVFNSKGELIVSDMYNYDADRFRLYGL